MHRIIFGLIAIACAFCDSTLLSAPPYLLLSFDVNQTIMLGDSSQQRTLEESLNLLLSARYIDRWDASQIEPLSFKEYVDTILAPGPWSDPIIKEKKIYHLYHFVDFVNATNHPLKVQVQRDYETMRDKIHSTPLEIFPSFFKLLHYLEKRGIGVSVAFRTYGGDLDAVINSSEETLNVLVTRAWFERGTLRTEEGVLLSQPPEIFHYFQRQPYVAVQDDYAWWEDRGRLQIFGKPFFVDTTSTNTLSLFFDDHVIENDDKQNIVCPIEVTTGKPLAVSALVKSGQIVKVNTVEALLDDDYFIRLVKKALKWHSEGHRFQLSEGLTGRAAGTASPTEEPIHTAA